MSAPDTAILVAAILNAAWLVRHYSRGAVQRNSPYAQKRAEAINKMGLAVREAFNVSDDFEVLLLAVLDGLSPRDEHRF